MGRDALGDRPRRPVRVVPPHVDVVVDLVQHRLEPLGALQRGDERHVVTRSSAGIPSSAAAEASTRIRRRSASTVTVAGRAAWPPLRMGCSCSGTSSRIGSEPAPRKHPGVRDANICARLSLPCVIRAPSVSGSDPAKLVSGVRPQNLSRTEGARMTRPGTKRLEDGTRLVLGDSDGAVPARHRERRRVSRLASRLRGHDADVAAGRVEVEPDGHAALDAGRRRRFCSGHRSRRGTFASCKWRMAIARG